MKDYNLSHLEELEAESIYVIREVASQFERPALLFSGGKDSIVCYHLARKAFYPASVPFPLMHVDTGHNFNELYEFRDQLMKDTSGRLIIASVQDSIDSGKVVEEKGINASRNKLQTTTLLDAIEENKFDCA
ncbi:MAG: phosphoadenosine phosphosulfate reductase family protein, partial [Bacteroidota bacterium]|nr:phosphoadenosine phosphosulfate reductase family protein [Bacteroidota bacterium]